MNKWTIPYIAFQIWIHVSWSGSGSGQMIRILPDPDPKHWLNSWTNLFICSYSSFYLFICSSVHSGDLTLYLFNLLICNFDPFLWCFLIYILQYFSDLLFHLFLAIYVSMYTDGGGGIVEKEIKMFQSLIACSFCLFVYLLSSLFVYLLITINMVDGHVFVHFSVFV